MVLPWLVTLLALVHAGHAYLFFGTPAQVPLSAAPGLQATTGEGPPRSSGSKSAITPEISAYAERLLQETHIPGLSVGVVRVEGDSIVAEYGAWGNMTEDGDATRPETLFSIGSCSKAFLASAIGILMDDFAQGRNVTALPPTVPKFTWDTKVQDLLPGDWAMEDEWATKKANVRDILTHVSGLTRHDLSWLNDDTPLDMIRRLRYMKQKYELREKWSYNNMMYVTAAHIVSTYSGRPYTAFVKERIFEPLKMTTTTYRWDDVQASQLFSHSWSGPERRRIPYLFAEEKRSEFIAGAGALISSTIDMTKWLAMLLHRGVNPYTKEIVVPSSTFDEMTTVHSIVEGQPANPQTSIIGYGMAWERSSYLGLDLVSHTGGLPGFYSEVSFLPERGLGIVAFINSDAQNAQVQASRRIMEGYFDLDRNVNVPQRSRPDDPLLAHSVPHYHSSQGPRCDIATSRVVPIEQYAGVYHNPAYENFTLCGVTTDGDTCRHILSEWVAVSPNGMLDPELLYGKSHSVLVPHLTMRRVCSEDGYESLFFLPATLLPKGYGKDDTPFAYRGAKPSEGIEVECEIGHTGEVTGCGLMNSEEGPRGIGETIRERADVWFSKVREV